MKISPLEVAYMRNYPASVVQLLDDGAECFWAHPPPPPAEPAPTLRQRLLFELGDWMMMMAGRCWRAARPVTPVQHGTYRYASHPNGPPEPEG